MSPLQGSVMFCCDVNPRPSAWAEDGPPRWGSIRATGPEARIRRPNGRRRREARERKGKRNDLVPLPEPTLSAASGLIGRRGREHPASTRKLAGRGLKARLQDEGGVPVKVRGRVIIPLPEPALSALSFRSLLAALRRGGDHSRHSEGAVENTPHLLASSRGGE